MALIVYTSYNSTQTIPSGADTANFLTLTTTQSLDYYIVQVVCVSGTVAFDGISIHR